MRPHVSEHLVGHTGALIIMQQAQSCIRILSQDLTTHGPKTSTSAAPSVRHEAAPPTAKQHPSWQPTQADYWLSVEGLHPVCFPLNTLDSGPTPFQLVAASSVYCLFCGIF